MSIEEALNILNNSKGHIVYDTGYKEICFSAQYVEALHTITRELKKEE